ncbi:MAG TPA: haloacid dehalogenase-like hydrolase, partial [Nitrospirales bacterium]|nr:haloacid dehalogenase-like hydrolase [Nitrospirales bacterium]
MSDEGIFLQNVIALIWDFDKTLSPVYMQKPLFDEFDINSDTFWEEVNALPDYYRQAGISINEDTCYLGHLLSYVQHGKMPGLTNAKLTELGSKIDLFPGLPGFFDEIKESIRKPEFAEADITIEHYIVSTGLDAMIRGTEVASRVDGIWASVFIEKPAEPGRVKGHNPEGGEISQIAGFLDNTTKTRAIFEINKGVNKTAGFSVNDSIDKEKRRVPFENMIYIADGPSDIPSFSVVKRNGGLAYAVYDPYVDGHYEQAVGLLDSKRVDQCGPADYRSGSETHRWLGHKVDDMARRILNKRKKTIVPKAKGS